MWRSPKADRRDASGFTLLEVVVAVAILAFGLTALYAAFSQGLAGVRRSGAAEEAGLVARSRLAEVGTLLPLAPGDYSGGEADGSRWRVTIRPFEAAAEGRFLPYLVRVEIEVAGHRLALETIRIAPGQGP